MNVLAIGNSFSQDATRYLHQIAKSEGDNFTVANLYIGGCELYRHYNNLINDNRAYSFEFNGEKTGIFVSIKQALRAQKWDIITLQQVSHKSPDYRTYHPYIDVLAAECRSACPNAKIFIHETWAYEEGSKRLCQELGYKRSIDMYKDIEKAYVKAANDIGADGIIPCGLTMKNLAEQGIVVHRDTFHANLGFGRYALGLTWYAAITGKDVSKNKFCDLDEECDPKLLRTVRKTVNNIFVVPEKKKSIISF
ncbi:MAG: DUF4886 domain-containing protein [Clostridia bacterium]|nr:DUF4886 domain-containing protein [Clostridia bacterium]